MFSKTDKRGVVLFIVLMTIVIVSTLASVVLSIMVSQARLTHHQASRIQAYYASQAGVNYAIEMLRIGPPTGWTVGTCTSGCWWTFSDGDFRPSSILNNSVQITTIPSGSAGCISSPGNTACIRVTANYTWAAP